MNAFDAGRNGFRVIPSTSARPIELYRVVRAAFRNTSILESLGEYDEDTGRYSIIGVVARAVLRGASDDCVLEDVASGATRKVDWVEVLDEWTGREALGRGASPVTLGAIGVLGYENRFRFDTLKRRLEPDHGFPDVWLADYSVIWVHDRKDGSASWIVQDGVSPDVCSALDRRSAEPAAGGRPEFHVLGDLSPDFTKEQYLESIRRTVEYIRNGDIFQANVTMRFRAAYCGDVFALYERLRTVTPNPFFAYFDAEAPLISTSPERFMVTASGKISTSPIKGTIRCAIDGQDQAEVLRSSVKNNAENTMITDLMRNDIGRVCRQGTVDVPVLCGLKRFNTLYHLESVVDGVLAPGTRMSDVLRATFPGGSITGAPKIRSEDILEELELTTRGPYTGATGFFGQNGWTETSIAIRIVYCDHGKLYFHAGGGIVVDSIPEDEYEELMLKVESIRNALSEFNVLGPKRRELDGIDEQLISLLGRRFSAIRDVAKIKRQYDIPLLQRTRVDEMLRTRKRLAAERGLGLSDAFIEDFYNLVVSHSMAIEAESPE